MNTLIKFLTIASFMAILYATITIIIIGVTSNDKNEIKKG